MLSRNLRRALLDTRWQIPPTFLLPWAAGLSTVAESATSTPSQIPPLQAGTNSTASRANRNTSTDASRGGIENAASTAPSTPQPKLPSPGSTSSKDLIDQLSPSVRDLLPILQSQGPHFITAHIHGRPYLVTQGDQVRLHFHMHGVVPGDILRLNCASLLGSREYTLKASAPAPSPTHPTSRTTLVLDPTSGTQASKSRVMPEGELASDGKKTAIPHFIPHIAKGKQSYLDERLFVCRAVVMGVESEPMRYKEKTKRRNRKVKTVKSKHKYTILKIKEVKVRTLEEIEAGEVD